MNNAPQTQNGRFNWMLIKEIQKKIEMENKYKKRRIKNKVSEKMWEAIKRENRSLRKKFTTCLGIDLNIKKFASIERATRTRKLNKKTLMAISEGKTYEAYF